MAMGDVSNGQGAGTPASFDGCNRTTPGRVQCNGEWPAVPAPCGLRLLAPANAAFAVSAAAQAHHPRCEKAPDDSGRLPADVETKCDVSS